MATELFKFPEHGYCGAQEAMEWLDMSKGTFYRSVRSGEIPHAHFGRGIRISRRGLVDYCNRGMALKIPPKPCEQCSPKQGKEDSGEKELQLSAPTPFSRSETKN